MSITGSFLARFRSIPATSIPIEPSLSISSLRRLLQGLDVCRNKNIKCELLVKFGSHFQQYVRSKDEALKEVVLVA